MWQQIIKRLFKRSNIEIGRDIIVHDSSTYRDMITRGSLGLGESYMKKKWDSPHLDVFISKLRKKLDFDSSIRIVNVRGVGYKMILNSQ